MIKAKRNLSAKLLASGLVLTAFSASCFAAPVHAKVAASSDESVEEANKALVIDFYNKAINDKNYAAAAKYLGSTYIQHNPTAPDGPEGLNTFIAYLQKSFPEQHNEIKHVYADGDTVILHVHSVQVPGTNGRAIVDIFRVLNGKVVEHWDVIQDVPAADTSRNMNTMF